MKKLYATLFPKNSVIRQLPWPAANRKFLKVKSMIAFRKALFKTSNVKRNFS